MQNPDYAQAQSTDFEEIPLIDVSAYGDEAAFDRLAEQVVETAIEVGFFYVTGHGIPAEERERAFAASRKFFALPEDQKASVAVNSHQRGWLAQGQTKLEGSKTHDAKEVFFWGYEIAEDDPDYLAGLPLVAPNQWPKAVAPWLYDEIQPYYRGVIDLARRLLSLMARGLGQSQDFFLPFYEKPLARGQLVYYPPMAREDLNAERMSAAAHTDFGVLTVLAQDDLGGLQVQNQAGDWIEAPPVPGSLVCNIGDLLEIWTGGKLHSTLHRVINRASKSRFSIPIFCDPASQTPIDPAAFGCPSGEAIVTAGEHIAGRNRKNFGHYKS